MWKEGDKVIFGKFASDCGPIGCRQHSLYAETKVKERGTTVLNAAAVTLSNIGKQAKAKL
jgi:hypothetical protein